MGLSRLFQNLFQLGQFPGKIASLGHLIVRLGIGIWMLNQCWSHLVGGEAEWKEIGASVGGDSFPLIWGLFIVLTENFGSILFILGLMTRVACFFLFVTTTVTLITHLNEGQDPSFYLILSIIYGAFVFIGAGRVSLDYWIGDRSGAPGSNEE